MAAACSKAFALSWHTIAAASRFLTLFLWMARFFDYNILCFAMVSFGLTTLGRLTFLVATGGESTSNGSTVFGT
jgi:hypothetical protein